MHPVSARWTPDSHSDACELCSEEFWEFMWRHHCRQCGKLVCALCAGKFVVRPHLGYGNESVRICTMCDRLSEEQIEVHERLFKLAESRSTEMIEFRNLLKKLRHFDYRGSPEFRDYVRKAYCKIVAYKYREFMVAATKALAMGSNITYAKLNSVIKLELRIIRASVFRWDRDLESTLVAVRPTDADATLAKLQTLVSQAFHRESAADLERCIVSACQSRVISNGEAVGTQSELFLHQFAADIRRARSNNFVSEDVRRLAYSTLHHLLVALLKQNYELLKRAKENTEITVLRSDLGQAYRLARVGEEFKDVIRMSTPNSYFVLLEELKLEARNKRSSFRASSWEKMEHMIQTWPEAA